MGKKCTFYEGTYTQSRPRSMPPAPNKTWIPDFSQQASTYFWTTYSIINGNYMAIVTLCLVVLLSFVLPDITQKIHKTQELNAMKKMIDLVSKDVSKAEVACLTVADQLTCLQCSMHDGSTETGNTLRDLTVCTTSDSLRVIQSAPVQVEKAGLFQRFFSPNKNASKKEIAIMSYVYTDSFDALGIRINDDASEVS